MASANSSEQAKARRLVVELDELLRETETGVFSSDLAFKDLEALRVNLKRARGCAVNAAAALGVTEFLSRPPLE